MNRKDPNSMTDTELDSVVDQMTASFSRQTRGNPTGIVMYAVQWGESDAGIYGFSLHRTKEGQLAKEKAMRDEMEIDGDDEDCLQFVMCLDVQVED